MTNEIHPPLGEQPEGVLNALEKLEEAKDKLFKNIDDLQENIRKLTEENKRLKTALGLVVNYDFKEPLVLTKDMEVKEPSWKDLVKEENNGHQ
jgi:regulator of replication initiation timing|tara:strand:- start:383 stop:661 length:279 start_codon:yes stop_codon:yes gene_type:complete